MSLRIDIQSERELHLLLSIARKPERFEKLNPEEKWMVYNSQFELRGHVPDEQLNEYERRLELKGETNEEKAKNLVERMVQPIKSRLTEK